MVLLKQSTMNILIHMLHGTAHKSTLKKKKIMLLTGLRKQLWRVVWSPDGIGLTLPLLMNIELT